MSKNKNSQLILVSSLGFALGMRQMAMTMVMPFLSVYSKELKFYTPVLAGVALGIFGLMQAIFQIPYGIWSDKKGNKIVMEIGLLQVIVGLIAAYFADNIYLLIFARALQGSGAVLAIGYSWISGASRNSGDRLKNMSIISMIVGAAAAVSFAFGPIINKFVPVKKMFLYSALIILAAFMIIVIFLNESNNKSTGKNISAQDAIKILIKDDSFISLNWAALINNFVMTGVFYTVPQYLEKITGLDGMWKVFMPAVVIAIIIMKIAVKRLDNVKSIKFLIANFIISSVGVLLYIRKESFIFIFIGTVLFMVGYISIATIIPNLGNELLSDEYRGTGNGIINSLQYIGSFAGSVLISAIWSKSEAFSFIVIAAAGIIGAVIVKLHVDEERFYERTDTAESC